MGSLVAEKSVRQDGGEGTGMKGSHFPDLPHFASTHNKLSVFGVELHKIVETISIC